MHVVAPQLTPEPYCLQAPLPSHEPLRLQVAAPSSGQSLSGSVSTFTFSQVPSTPAPFLVALHAWQAPAQGASQHTPSTQLPLRHCELPEHDRPLSMSGWQVPSLRQNAFDVHWPSLVQLVPQAVALAHR